MNKKGFTLIELISTIVIIGFVSLMAFPSISNAISSNKTSTCKYYEKSMIIAAKAYIQKNEVDLIENNGNASTWTQNLPLKNKEGDIYDLITNDYIEAYKDSKTTVTDASVSVTAKRINNSTAYKYTYTPHLSCKNTLGKVLYSK